LQVRSEATGTEFLTVRVAALLVAVPAALVTVTVYCELLSPITVTGVV
jgi:hypothetical protein